MRGRGPLASRRRAGGAGPDPASAVRIVFDADGAGRWSPGGAILPMHVHGPLPSQGSPRPASTCAEKAPSWP